MAYKEKTPKGLMMWRGKVMREYHEKRRWFRTRAEAIAWEAEQKALPLEVFLSETPTEYSLAEWAEQYLDHAKVSFSSGVYHEKKFVFAEFFKSIKPEMSPRRLHPGVILKHLNFQSTKRSGNAANKDRKNLIAAWNWAVRYLPGWPRENPFTLTERQRGEEHPRYIPPVEDFWRVLDMTHGQDKVMLLAYLHTAARKHELFDLAWDDVDFERHRIRLWTRKRKGGKEADWIPMTVELEAALKDWNENRTFKNSPYVFLCEDKTPFCQEYFGRPFLKRLHWMTRLCKRAGVTPFGVHAIRHLSASILDDKNYPITIIQALLRHKSANTTAKYLHKLRGMKTALDDAFRRSAIPSPELADQDLRNSEPRNSLRLVPQDLKQNRPQVEEATRERPVLRLIKFR